MRALIYKIMNKKQASNCFGNEKPYNKNITKYSTLYTANYMNTYIKRDLIITMLPRLQENNEK